MKESKTKALVYTLACVGLWSLIPVVSRFGQAELDHYQFLLWSSLFSLVVVLMSTLIAGKGSHLLSCSKANIALMFLLGFLGTFLYYLLLYYGYKHAKGLEVLVLQYTWPIFIVIFSWLILHERLTIRTLISALLGFIGITLVLSKGDLQQINLSNVQVDGIVLLAATAFGLFSVLSKKCDTESFTLTTYLFLAATAFSVLALFTFSSFAIPTGSAWIPILINGAFINGLSYVLWMQALKAARASFVAPFVFLTPVLSAFWIVLFFGEPMLVVYLVGLGCVIGAGLASS